MTWQEVCEDKSLQNLPYKIELDQWGRIVMSPANNRHARWQFKIAHLIEIKLGSGEALVECSVDTPMGTKVPNAAWASDAFLKKHGYDTPYPEAPEICVEVRSRSNTAAEIAEKIMLFLSKGAKEVWVCDEDGNISFHDHTGKLAKSKMLPRFPNKI
ncbi:MAG TPA: Uma2 family endonuclease [Planctomycetota bacterium]|nr:Uma2 family endonuclease [Planctomycetota bacterium]